MLAPVRPDEGGRAIGVIALARSTVPLHQRITALWIWLAAVSAGGLLAAAAVAVALVRWVSRPLVALDQAARRLGDGALDTRSPADRGPAEVRRLSANFNTMAGRLEALVDGHQAMMADVSHQLRTPLAALRLRLDVLAQDAGEAVADDLAGAQEEVARLSRLVNGLLAVAKAENVVAEPVTVAADVVIRDRTAAWQLAAEERGVVLDVNPEPVDVRARRRPAGADPGQPARQRPRCGPGGWQGPGERAGRGLPGAHRGGRRWPGHDRAAAAVRLPAVRQQYARRHRSRPGHRAPAGDVERRFSGAFGHAGRRADGHAGAAERATRPGNTQVSRGNIVRARHIYRI